MTSPQIAVTAHDLASPPKESETPAAVTVRVQRNKNCPQFQSEPYGKQIDQTQPVNSEVLQVEAVDFDPQVVQYFHEEPVFFLIRFARLF